MQRCCKDKRDCKDTAKTNGINKGTVKTNGIAKLLQKQTRFQRYCTSKQTGLQIYCKNQLGLPICWVAPQLRNLVGQKKIEPKSAPFAAL